MDHRYYMGYALEEARIAFEMGEVPIGAVIVKQGKIISATHNMKETWQDPTAHAEVIAMRNASKSIGSWRLSDCTLYVTLEPCPMCAGAIVQARIKQLVYGAPDLKAGAVDSVLNVVENPKLNHRVEVIPGIMSEESKKLMQLFFKQRRG